MLKPRTSVVIKFELFCTCEWRLCLQAEGRHIIHHIAALLQCSTDRAISGIDTLACIELLDGPFPVGQTNGSGPKVFDIELVDRSSLM